MSNNLNNEQKFIKQQKNFITILIAVIVFFVGWEIFDHINTKKWVEYHHNYERGKVGFDLINPKVVKYELPDIGVEIIGSVEDYIKKISTGQSFELGFYVRDLDSGYGFGLNENDDFIPASLLKMFTMMTYFKISEDDPDILYQTIVYENKNDLNNFQNIQPRQELVLGESYKIQDLIERSIIYSDNNANMLLIQNIDEKMYRQTFTELGIPYATSGEQKAITPKLYANIFRVLYNSSFLNETNSQKALKILNDATFNGGLQAGLNGNVKLANKFGERKIVENGKETSYLHDCGIIYSKHPYVLCVMTKGEDMKFLEKVLSNVSNLVYSKMKY